MNPKSVRFPACAGQGDICQLLHSRWCLSNHRSLPSPTQRPQLFSSRVYGLFESSEMMMMADWMRSSAASFFGSCETISCRACRSLRVSASCFQREGTRPNRCRLLAHLGPDIAVSRGESADGVRVCLGSRLLDDLLEETASRPVVSHSRAFAKHVREIELTPRAPSR